MEGLSKRSREHLRRKDGLEKRGSGLLGLMRLLQREGPSSGRKYEDTRVPIYLVLMTHDTYTNTNTSTSTPIIQQTHYLSAKSTNSTSTNSNI